MLRWGRLCRKSIIFPFFGTDVSDEIAEREGTRAIEEAFQLYMPADKVAAVIIEPIQGDAGDPAGSSHIYEKAL